MSSILSSVEGGVIGVAVGEGAAAAVEPVVEPAKQEVWHANPFRVLDPELLAQLVVQAIADFGPAADQAQRSGYDRNKFRAMVEATFKAPGTAEALELWRRGRINREQVQHALHKAGLETQYIAPVLELFGERLDVAAIANAIQQGFLANDGVLPAPTPPQPDWTAAAGPFTIPTEQVALRDADGGAVSTLAEAQASGIDAGRLTVLAELAGLPPGEETLLELWRREIIDSAGYATGLREGHTKTKWTAALSARFHQLLPPGVLVRLRLKGWITPGDYEARMKLHGYRPETAEDWWLSEGRPATVRQTMIGLRRGGVYDAPITDTPEPFRSAVLQSDISNHWAHLLYMGRETYPSLFVIRSLLQAGVWDAARGEDVMFKAGYPQEMAREIARHFATSQAVAVDGRVKSAETNVLTRIRNVYIQQRADEAQARTWLGGLGIDAATQDGLIRVWNVGREVPGSGLTRSQVKKAWRTLPTEWPRDRALAELEALGMEPDEAQTFLDE